jgi:tetratricopeptide (TPR) repeat protein
MSRLNLVLSCTALVLLWPSSVRAQVKDAFLQGVADFVNAANGLSGDEGPALTAAIDAMANGLGQWDAAVAKVEAGLAAQIGGAPPPVAARMRATLGAVYLERGRLADALEQFDAAVRLDAEVRDVQSLRGLLYQRMNRPSDAQSAFRSALRQEPGDVTTVYLLLRVASKSADAGERNAAMKTLADAVENATPEGRAQFTILDFLEGAAVSAPVFVPAVYNEAATFLTQAKYDEAVAFLRKSAMSSSLVAARDERARLATADARMSARDPGGARAALVDALRAFPNSGMGHWKLGRVQLALGDEAAAMRSFQTAAGLPSLGGTAHLYAAMGRVQHNQLDLEGAVAAYARRVELTPNDAAAHTDLGDVYRAQDRLDEALAEYLIGSLVDPTSVKALVAAAQIHGAAGRDESAVKLLRRAVALEPSHLEARYALSRGLLRLGLTDDARRELEVFEQLQKKAMQDERRRFEENQIKIDETLKSGDTREPAR